MCDMTRSSGKCRYSEIQMPCRNGNHTAVHTAIHTAIHTTTHTATYTATRTHNAVILKSKCLVEPPVAISENTSTFGIIFNQLFLALIGMTRPVE